MAQSNNKNNSSNYLVFWSLAADKKVAYVNSA